MFSALYDRRLFHAYLWPMARSQCSRYRSQLAICFLYQDSDLYVLLHVHIQEEGENGVEEHSLEMRVDVEMMELEVEVEADSVGVKVIALVGRSLQSLKVK
jgi:hypothetical protein